MGKEFTLRQYLDMIGINKGDDSPLIIVVGCTEMQVSRRYLESAPMKQYLDLTIIKHEYPYTNVRGTGTIKFWLKEED